MLAMTVVLFGASWPVMKVALASATPLWFAAGRSVLISATVFAVLALRREARVPPRGDWPLVASVGTAQIAAFFACSHFGLMHMPAGRGVVIAYSTPIWVLPLASLFLREPLGVRGILGSALGLAGLGALLMPELPRLGSPGVLVGEAWLLGAALGWAIAIVHSRYRRWESPPLQLLAWQMGLAACWLLPAAAILEPDGRIAPTPESLLALLFLSLFVGPIGAWGAAAVARALPANVSSIGFLAAPLIGVAVSTLWLDERLGWDIVLGGSLILVGLAVAARKRAG
ncbi:MAG: DMT family transporter [Alphaproteobacteria bacterium]|nr:DMT family transporter [Alphaproteobacteria bacterium]